MYRCICTSRDADGPHHHNNGQVQPCSSRNCWLCRQPSFIELPMPRQPSDEDTWTADEIAEINSAAKET